MARRIAAPGERPLHWVGRAWEEVMSFPEEVVHQIGFDLGTVQFGQHPHSARPWHGEGPGVVEIITVHYGNTYRTVYTIRFSEAVFVLYAFQKKSTHGISTPKRHIETIRRRLQEARRQYEAIYGSPSPDR